MIRTRQVALAVITLLASTLSVAAATITTATLNLQAGRKLGAAAENELGLLVVYYTPSLPTVDVIFRRHDGTETRHSMYTIGNIYNSPRVTQFDDRFVVTISTYGQHGAIDALAITRDGLTRLWVKQLITVPGWILDHTTRTVDDHFVVTTEFGPKLEQYLFTPDGAPAGPAKIVVDHSTFIGVFDELFAPDGKSIWFFSSMFDCRTLCIVMPVDFWITPSSEAVNRREKLGESLPYPHAASHRGVSWIATINPGESGYKVMLQRLDLSTETPALIGSPHDLSPYDSISDLFPFGAGFLLLASTPDHNYNYTLHAVELSATGARMGTTVIGELYRFAHARIGVNGGVVFDKVREGGVIHDLEIVRPTHRKRQIRRDVDSAPSRPFNGAASAVSAAAPLRK